MKKITYLLGAGASANALPVVKNFAADIYNVVETIKGVGYQLSIDEKFKDLNYTGTKEQGRTQLIEDLNWLAAKASEHASVDTYAKKLFIKEDDKTLEKLKAALSVYLVLAQTGKRYDKRYDAFLASILEKQYEFPNHIRIVSWNYDYQLEMAYSDFYNDDSISRLQNALHVVSKFSSTKKEADKFAVYKLNGSADLNEHRGFRKYYFTSSLREALTIKEFENMVRNYLCITHAPLQGVYSGLSFAWENTERTEEAVLPKAINGTSATEVLVIIGYSFPFFNREVDRKLIGAMTNLKKVYFQDKNPHAINLRFDAVKNHPTKIETVLYNDVEQFILPDEL